jgi:metal-responsive CopG/Arc/MetJ family transcriptional regulator
MKYSQISLKLPEEVLDKVDKVAKSRYKKRSEVIREAVVAYVGAHHEGTKKTSNKAWGRRFHSLITDMGPTDAVREHDTVF